MDDLTSQPTSSAQPPATPKWVKAFAIFGAVLIILIVVVLVGGGNHGPGRHLPSEPTPAAPTSMAGIVT